MLKESVADVFLPSRSGVSPRRHCVFPPRHCVCGRGGERDAGFTLVELLVVIAIISVIAGFLIPTLMKARGKADLVHCANNLRELQKLGMMYADSGGNRFYPLQKGSNPPAHESLNILVKSNQGALKPELFICRTWRGGTAEVVDGKFTLDENTCSYTWPKQKVSPSDSGPLSCDKHVFSEEDKNGHADGRNVVFTDGSIDFMTTEVLPAEELPKGLVR